VLLTETPPRTVLRGRAAAGLTVGLPVATVLPLGSIAVGTPAAIGLGFAVVGAGLSVVAAGFALGLGCAYPIYETRELWGAETVAPSTLVLVGYSLVAASGTVTWLLLAWFWLAGGLDPTAAHLGSVAILTLLTGGVSVLSYRYAKRRYRRDTL
jgi:ABC-2 type transport system permease protein